MSLIYFHRFLIVCSILFALYFAWFAFERVDRMGGTERILTIVISLVAAVGLGFYLRTVKLPARRD